MSSAHWRQTGGIWPMGVPTSLTWYDLGALLTLIQGFGVRSVVEIGVERGGAASLLAAHCRHTGRAYHGIDITLEHVEPIVTQRGAHIEQRDGHIAATVAEIEGWLTRPALIFCDGGDKPKELHLYAALIRPGDVLVGHDYGNEYTEEAIADIRLERIAADWLDDTLLCAWRG